MVSRGLKAEVLRDHTCSRSPFASPDPDRRRRSPTPSPIISSSPNLDRRFEASNYARKFLENKLQDVKAKLEDSERHLVQYAQAQQIINVDEGKPLSNGTLLSLNAAVDNAKADRIKAQALWDQASNSSGLGLPQIENNTAIQQLEADRGKLASQYQEGLQTFNADYPKMQQTKAQIDEVNRQIQAQISDVKESLKSQYLADLQLEHTLSSQLGEAKSGALNLRSRSIEYDTLQRESTPINRSMTDCCKTTREVGISGGVGTNNISVIDRALPPGLPFNRTCCSTSAAALWVDRRSRGRICSGAYRRSLKVPRRSNSAWACPARRDARPRKRRAAGLGPGGLSIGLLRGALFDPHSVTIRHQRWRAAQPPDHQQQAERGQIHHRRRPRQEFRAIGNARAGHRCGSAQSLPASNFRSGQAPG